jgi:hypothetical protein
MPDTQGSKRRWCTACAKQHPGAICAYIQIKQRCTDCGVKTPHYGMPEGDRKRKWCAPCASKHPGAIDVVAVRCEHVRPARTPPPPAT